jgi:mannose-6-phosphate isomerase
METKAIHKSPWGTWEVLEDSELYKVKKIRINPLQRLSYQKHFKREENWFIVEGTAEVTVDGVEKILQTGDFIHIPQEALHRIKNISEVAILVFIEIQRGTYFGEDDIVRMTDDYGRL